MNRTAAPLVAADGALEIDSTALSIDQVVETVVEFVKNKFN
jgi:cytidylate kinase